MIITYDQLPEHIKRQLPEDAYTHIRKLTDSTEPRAEWYRLVTTSGTIIDHYKLGFWQTTVHKPHGNCSQCRMPLPMVYGTTLCPDCANGPDKGTPERKAWNDGFKAAYIGWYEHDNPYFGRTDDLTLKDWWKRGFRAGIEDARKNMQGHGPRSN